MGLMEKFRASTKYILWVLIFSFVILWSLADTQVFDSMMAGPRSLGTVNGEPISFEEYNLTVNNYMQNYQFQTGESASAELRSYYEELAWDNLVMNKIMKGELTRLGITVTDEEIVEMITGPNPAPFIAQQFTREDGTVDRVALQQAIEAPENAQVWINIEDQLREQLAMEKLNRYIQSSVRISDAEVNMDYINQNSTASAQFVRFPYSEITDSSITVTESELRAYVNKNADRYKQEKSYRFNYVTFSKEATPEDSVRIRTEIENLREQFRVSTNDSLFLIDNLSTTPYNSTYRARNQVQEDFAMVFDMANGDISPIIETPGRLTVIKRIDGRTADERLTRLSQIQLTFNDANKAEVQAKARDLAQQARGNADFANLAQNNSQDPSTSGNGGDLGYVLASERPQPIASAIASANVGAVVGPIEHEGAFYILKVVARETEEVKFAEMSLNIEADPFGTIDKQAKDADDFSFYAREDGFAAEVERRGVSSLEAFATEGNPFISGLGQSRVVMNYLMRAKVGDISESIDMDNQFIVVEVLEIIPAGTRPMDDIRPQIETLVRNEKRKEMMLEQVKSQIAGQTSLDGISNVTNKPIQPAENVRLNALTLPSAGREPEIVGLLFALEPNTLSAPVKGESAIFVVQVTNRTMADATALTDTERESIRTRLQQARSASYQQNWIEELKKKADIEDFRTRVLQ
jgi:peptidylprolyl isomerase/peptidyl-prolyl cis-trans isomerase D